MDNMKRSDFLATLFGAPVVAKAIDMTPRPDGKPPLLVFETPGILHESHLEKIRECIVPLAKQNGFEFMVLQDGMTVKRVL